MIVAVRHTTYSGCANPAHFLGTFDDEQQLREFIIRDAPRSVSGVNVWFAEIKVGLRSPGLDDVDKYVLEEDLSKDWHEIQIRVRAQEETSL